jgi:hypothetical protein
MGCNGYRTITANNGGPPMNPSRCMKYRLAVRAAEFVPEADSVFECGWEKHNLIRRRRGSFEGAIRMPLRSSLFLFNDLVFLRIPRKSLKFLTSLFSLPTSHQFKWVQPFRLELR